MTGICVPHDGNISDEHQVSECFSEHSQHGKSIPDLDLAVGGRGSILLEKQHAFMRLQLWVLAMHVSITCEQGALKGFREESHEFSFISSQVFGKLMQVTWFICILNKKRIVPFLGGFDK